MKSLRLSLLLSTLGLLAATASPFAQSQAPSMPGYPGVGAPALVTLASPGAEPRTRLRYRIAADHKSAMLMTMAVGVSVNVAGMSMPAMEMPVMKMTANLTVTGVAPNGDVTYEVAFTGMSAEALPGMDPSMVAMMQAAAAGITQLRATAIVNDRGINRDMKVDLDKITDPSLRMSLGSLSSSIESMSTPLPEEAVGVGARWEVRQVVRANDAHTFQRIECELVSIEGAVVNLRAKIEQNTPPQVINNPMLPAGASMEIEKMTGSGSGTLAIRLDGLVPTSEISSTSSASMIMNMGGQTQNVNTDTRMKINVAPAAVK